MFLDFLFVMRVKCKKQQSGNLQYKSRVTKVGPKMGNVLHLEEPTD